MKMPITAATFGSNHKGFPITIAIGVLEVSMEDFHETSAFEGRADMAPTRVNVRYWHKADILTRGTNVRFRG
jgi:hypothetical protein